ncbi:MAG: hypothetical protein AAGI50_19015 [Pseudomonadota bacterium]
MIRLLPLILLGCAVISGFGDDVRTVRATYEAEFERALTAHGTASPKTAFADTLAAIATARSDTEDPGVLAYLSVLEGMVLLQTGDVAGAEARLGDVAAAAQALGRQTPVPRDALLADIYPDLVAGGAALAARDGASAAELRAGADALAQAGRNVQGRLCALRSAGRLPDPATDGGAAYAAATAASYLASVDADAGLACRPADDALPVCAAAAARQHLVAARDLTATFPPGTPAPALTARAAEIAARADRQPGLPAPEDACR